MADKPSSDPGKTEQLSNWENEGGALEELHEDLDDRRTIAIPASRNKRSRLRNAPVFQPLR